MDVAQDLIYVISHYIYFKLLTQPAIICSKLTLETLEKSVKYVQS